MSDPTKAATISRNEIATLSSPGKSPNMRNSRPPTKAPMSSHPQIPEKAKPLAVPGNDQPGKASAKQTYDNPDNELTE